MHRFGALGDHDEIWVVFECGCSDPHQHADHMRDTQRRYLEAGADCFALRGWVEGDGISLLIEDGEICPREK